MTKVFPIMDEVLKEIQENHNYTWFEEIYNRNKNTLGDIALIYRGNKFTYGKMFEEMLNYAKSLKTLGIKKGDEIAICMSNTPELVYLLGAASMIGAIVNIYSEEFDKDYITEIVDSCTEKAIFIEDRKFSEISEVIEKSHAELIVMTSLMDSLKNGKVNKYDEKHGQFVNLVGKYKQNNEKIIDINAFEKLGESYENFEVEDCDLDDVFSVTYSSGSTNSTRPKAIVHTIRSFITIGRCHDPEIQKSASMKKFIIEAHIPTHSNTDIICSISDALMQGSKLALEPIYDKDFFIYSLLINKPTYIVATTSFWIATFKKVLYDFEFKNINLSHLLIPFAVGEPLSPGEEKFINKGLRKAKELLPISCAGGDCEHGGIYWILFRALRNKLPYNSIRNQEQGLLPFAMVESAILDENGNHLPRNSYGRLVANSPCNMKEYKNNPIATEEFFIKDSEGKVWGNCNVYAYIDEHDGIHMKGRIPDKEDKVKLFMIDDIVMKDTKNILSCETVFIDGSYIIHVELQPDRKKSIEKVLKSIYTRCYRNFDDFIVDKMYIRLRSFDEAFPLTCCGKRSRKDLISEGFSEKCIKLSSLNETSELSLKLKK